jgi:hypothetical protein
MVIIKKIGNVLKTRQISKATPFVCIVFLHRFIFLFLC